MELPPPLVADAITAMIDKYAQIILDLPTFLNETTTTNARNTHSTPPDHHHRHYNNIRNHALYMDTCINWTLRNTTTRTVFEDRPFSKYSNESNKQQQQHYLIKEDGFPYNDKDMLRDWIDIIKYGKERLRKEIEYIFDELNKDDANSFNNIYGVVTTSQEKYQSYAPKNRDLSSSSFDRLEQEKDQLLQALDDLNTCNVVEFQLTLQRTFKLINDTLLTPASSWADVNQVFEENRLSRLTSMKTSLLDNNPKHSNNDASRTPGSSQQRRGKRQKVSFHSSTKLNLQRQRLLLDGCEETDDTKKVSFVQGTTTMDENNESSYEEGETYRSQDLLQVQRDLSNNMKVVDDDDGGGSSVENKKSSQLPNDDQRDVNSNNVARRNNFEKGQQDTVVAAAATASEISEAPENGSSTEDWANCLYDVVSEELEKEEDEVSPLQTQPPREEREDELRMRFPQQQHNDYGHTSTTEPEQQQQEQNQLGSQIYDPFHTKAAVAGARAEDSSDEEEKIKASVLSDDSTGSGDETSSKPRCHSKSNDTRKTKAAVVATNGEESSDDDEEEEEKTKSPPNRSSTSAEETTSSSSSKPQWQLEDAVRDLAKERQVQERNTHGSNPLQRAEQIADEALPERVERRNTTKAAVAAVTAAAVASGSDDDNHSIEQLTRNDEKSNENTTEASRFQIRSRPNLRRNPQQRFELKFDDTDDEEDENVDSPSNSDVGWRGRRIHLTELPEHGSMSFNIATSSAAASSTTTNNAKRERTATTQKRRRRFTDEEKDAIREGVELFGVGHWADIKAHFTVALRYRTSVQIKDCYRTMSRNNEL